MDGSQDTLKNTKGNDQQMVVSRFKKLLPFKKEKSLPEHSSVSLETPSTQTNKSKKPKKKWYKRPGLIIPLILALIILAVFAHIAYVGNQTAQYLKEVMAHGQAAATAIEARDLGTSRAELKNAKTSLSEARNSYSRLSPYSYLPFFGNYVKDGDHAFAAGQIGIETGELALDALEPYADVLGFAGAESELSFETAEERIVFLSETVEKLTPQMASIGANLTLISQELNAIDPARYPKKLADFAPRQQLIKVQETVASTATSLSDFEPFIKLLPDLLGNPEKRRYLILFQNDAELRPTGGFMTAYATMDILKGKIDAGISQDIYSLDNAFKGNVPAPDPIKKFLPLVYTWYLRDMNLSPDFKVSMDTFTKYYNQVGSSAVAPEVDAIIAIDTEIPVRLLEILGPIGVPGYGGQFSAEPDPRCESSCPQVIYELENIITRPTYEIREGRKSILGPLMNSMLANMMGSPKSKWPEFFSVFTEGIREKHLMMYFFDEDKQAAVEALGAAGRIVDYPGDYLHINDTNFAGAKSNLFVEQEVNHQVSVGEDGSVSHKLSLTYKNPAAPSNCNLEAGELCLNGVLRDWIRFYVPKGSSIVGSKGFEIDMVTGEDLGKTVFEGFFTLAPESVKKLELEYTTPPGTIPSLESYNLFVQKQPGTKSSVHTFSINGGAEEEYLLDADQEFIFPL